MAMNTLYGRIDEGHVLQSSRLLYTCETSDLFTNWCLESKMPSSGFARLCNRRLTRAIRALDLDILAETCVIQRRAEVPLGKEMVSLSYRPEKLTEPIQKNLIWRVREST